MHAQHTPQPSTTWYDTPANTLDRPCVQCLDTERELSYMLPQMIAATECQGPAWPFALFAGLKRALTGCISS